MKNFILLAALLFSCNCATTKVDAGNPYAYSGVMTKPECDAQCASYGFRAGAVKDGACICDTSSCARSLGKGGCEKLQARPVP